MNFGLNSGLRMLGRNRGVFFLEFIVASSLRMESWFVNFGWNRGVEIG